MKPRLSPFGSMSVLMQVALLSVFAVVASQAVVFAVGVPWLAVVADLDATQALSAGLYPFLVGGAVKAAIAGLLLPTVWRFAGAGSSPRP